MNRTHVVVVLAVALALSGVGLPGVGLQAATPATAQELEAPSASFVNTPVTVTRGADAKIEVKHNRDAKVWLDGVMVGNLTGSGTSTVTVDTYAPGVGEENTSLTVGEHQLGVTIDGNEYDFGTLVVEKREPPSVSVGTVAGWKYDLSDGVGTISDNGRATTNATKGELVAITFDTHYLQKAYEDLPANASDDDPVMVRFEQRDPPINTDGDGFRVATAPADEIQSTSSFGDDGTGSITVAWDTSDVYLGPDDETTYNVTLVLGSANKFVAERTVTAHTTIRVEEPRMSYSVSDKSLKPWDEEFTVTGQTNRAPGTAIEFWARNPGTYQQRNQVTVGEDGTFQTTFDVSEVPEDTRIEVLPRLVLPDETIPYEDQMTTIQIQKEAAAVAIEEQESDGTAVTLRTASLSLDGHVRVVDSINRTLGTQYFPAGDHHNQTIELEKPLQVSRQVTVIAHVDRNRSETFEPGIDRRFRAIDSDSQITDTAIVNVTNPPAATESAGTNATAETTTEASTAPTNESDAGAPNYLTKDVEANEPISPVTEVQSDLNPALVFVAVGAVAWLLARRR